LQLYDLAHLLLRWKWGKYCNWGGKLHSTTFVWSHYSFSQVQNKQYCSAHIGKGKGKVHPRTDHERPEREKRYSSTLP